MIGLFRPSRERQGPDPWLNAKVAIFCVGACVALIGIATETSWIINTAIGILIVGFALRFVRPKTPEEDAPEE